MRTVSEIEEHFKMEGADFACEWLVEKGLLQKDVGTGYASLKRAAWRCRKRLINYDDDGGRLGAALA